MNNTDTPKSPIRLQKQERMGRYVYGIFTIAGILFIFMKDWNNALIFFGLAPVFDPFKPIKFSDRPRWQRAWLFAHVAITMALFVAMIWRR
jgi:hypothetical protein